MAFGKPPITIPRGEQFDQRAWAAVVTALVARIQALEAALTDQQNMNLNINTLINSSTDGFVVKVSGKLLTRVLQDGGGLTITNPAGQKDDPTFSVP
jgi:hypothetical protein